MLIGQYKRARIAVGDRRLRRLGREDHRQRKRRYKSCREVAPPMRSELA